LWLVVATLALNPAKRLLALAEFLPVLVLAVCAIQILM
jgi:hypothetical protein